MMVNSPFLSGPIHCGPTTARLLEHVLDVPARYIVVLELGVRHAVGPHYVTLIDANHCPGAVMFLFEVRWCRAVRVSGCGLL
jgi:DNA ligase-1